MNLHWKALKEEMDFYIAQNESLAIDDLLRKIFGKKPRYQKLIAENEERIRRMVFYAWDF